MKICQLSAVLSVLALQAGALILRTHPRPLLSAAADKPRPAPERRLGLGLDLDTDKDMEADLANPIEAMMKFDEEGFKSPPHEDRLIDVERPAWAGRVLTVDQSIVSEAQFDAEADAGQREQGQAQ